MDLTTYIFSLSATVNGEPRQGQFIGRRLTQRQLREVKVRASLDCGGMYPVIDQGGWTGKGVDPLTYEEAKAWAHMELAFSPPNGQRPDWFDQAKLYDDFADDESVALKVWREVQRQEESFRSTGRPAPAEAGAGRVAAVASATGGDGAGSAGHRASDVRPGAAALVGGQVPAALQP